MYLISGMGDEIINSKVHLITCSTVFWDILPLRRITCAKNKNSNSGPILCQSLYHICLKVTSSNNNKSPTLHVYMILLLSA